MQQLSLLSQNSLNKFKEDRVIPCAVCRRGQSLACVEKAKQEGMNF